MLQSVNHRWEVLCLTKNRKTTLLRLLNYVKQVRHLLLLAILITFVSNYFALYAPKLTGLAIDAIGVNKSVDFEKVFYYCAWLLFFYAMNSLLNYVLQRILINASKKITYQMREEVFHHLGQLSVEYFDHNQTGNIISRISYDIDTINTSLSSDILQLVTGIITVVGSLYMMITISSQLILVFVITLPIAFFVARYRMKKVKPLFRLRSHKLGELNGFTEEMLSGNKTIKAYGQEDSIQKNYNVKNEETSEAYYRAEYEGSMMGPTMMFVNNLSLALISMFGAILFLQGKISIGDISSFVMYSRKFSGPINETANIITELQSATSAAERVFRLLDEPVEREDEKDAVELSDVKGHVTVEDVSFGYVKDKEVLHHVSFEAQPGEMVAIVGPTGAGKTTIINLLMRFYEIEHGRILLDDIPIDQIKRASLRKSFAMVLQDTWLFEGTVAQNIAYAKQHATLEEVIEVCKKAHIHNFIMSLPKGYDTLITDDGVNISKGQKQLMTIARAMLSEAKMLILDEATSNVDSRTEMLIQQAMFELMKNKTSFVIAHRLSTIQKADKILVLKNGEIIESGTHESLLESKGFYARLFNSQFD